MQIGIESYTEIDETPCPLISLKDYAACLHGYYIIKDDDAVTQVEKRPWVDLKAVSEHE